MLTSGMVPALFPDDEKEGIIGQVISNWLLKTPTVHLLSILVFVLMLSSESFSVLRNWGSNSWIWDSWKRFWMKHCDWSAKRVPANQVETWANRDVFTPFSRVQGRWHVFPLILLIGSSCQFFFALIGCCDYFDFGFTIFHRKLFDLKNRLFHSLVY